MKKVFLKYLAAALSGVMIFGTSPAASFASSDVSESTPGGAIGSLDDIGDLFGDLAGDFIEKLIEIYSSDDPDEALFKWFDELNGDKKPGDPDYVDWRAIWNANDPYPMYRLYNHNSGEHFYTADPEERADVIAAGWNDEGIGWWAPLTLKNPVYRLYNANGGEHHYTLDLDECRMLIEAGWNYEGQGWSSADESEGIPVYREYNPNQFSCNHNFTQDKEEHDYLVSIGWKDEGIAWYAAKKWNSYDVSFDNLVTELCGEYSELNGSGLNLKGEPIDRNLIISFDLPYEISKDASLSVSASWGASANLRKKKELGDNANYGISAFGFNASEATGTFEIYVYLPDDQSIEGSQTVTIEVGGSKKDVPVTLSYEGDYKTGTGWQLI